MNKLTIGLVLFLVISVSANGFLLTGCKSFQPKDYVIEGESPECNDVYVTMGFYSLVEKSDSAFIGTVYGECQKSREASRKARREKHCKDLYFGEGNVNKTEYEKYVQYLECQK